jgi:protein-tyrosine phosphatase
LTTILFVCGKNRRRSTTSEAIFAGMDGIEVSSAGTSPEAACSVSADLLVWADQVFVMEERQWPV